MITQCRSGEQDSHFFDEKILESPEVKKALQEGKIEIIDDEKHD